MAHQITNFIFDIDGTLINTYEKYMPPMIDVMEKHGYHVPADQVDSLKRKLFGITGADSLRQGGVKEEDIPEMVAEWRALSFQREDLVTVFPGIKEMIMGLAARPDTKLAIATSKVREDYQEHFVNDYDWTKYFDVAVTEELTSNHKPDPYPILLAMDKLSARPENSVYVGDTINDLKAAHNAGIKFAGALYGSSQPQNIQDADYPLHEPQDLLKID